MGGQIHKTSQFSEHTLETIDNEVHTILTTAAKRAMDMLVEHKDDLEAITRGLMEHEELDRKQITELIGESVHAAKQKARADEEAKTKAEKEAKAEQETKQDAADSDKQSEPESKPAGDS